MDPIEIKSQPAAAELGYEPQSVVEIVQPTTPAYDLIEDAGAVADSATPVEATSLATTESPIVTEAATAPALESSAVAEAQPENSAQLEQWLFPQ